MVNDRFTKGLKINTHWALDGNFNERQIDLGTEIWTKNLVQLDSQLQSCH